MIIPGTEGETDVQLNDEAIRPPDFDQRIKETWKGRLCLNLCGVLGHSLECGLWS